MFSEKIRLLREERHLTQLQFSKEIGMSPRGYQSLELGIKPRYDNLLAIANYYNVSLDWLAGRSSKREVTP